MTRAGRHNFLCRQEVSCDRCVCVFQVVKRLKSKPQDALEGVVLSVSFITVKYFKRMCE